jgi:superfamily I DNA/RNA helicase
LEWLKIERDPASEAKIPGVRLATMHRLKGLEFSRVILAGVQAGKMPLKAGDYADHASLEDHELRERCLLYVACTRARDDLVIVGYGQPSPFLEAI